MKGRLKCGHPSLQHAESDDTVLLLQESLQGRPLCCVFVQGPGRALLLSLGHGELSTTMQGVDSIPLSSNSVMNMSGSPLRVLGSRCACTFSFIRYLSILVSCALERKPVCLFRVLDVRVAVLDAVEVCREAI